MSVGRWEEEQRRLLLGLEMFEVRLGILGIPSLRPSGRLILPMIDQS
jgi:hypothetical protein